MIPRLHVVTDDQVLALRDFEERARTVLDTGRDRVLVQLRGPGTPVERLWRLGERLLPVARGRGVPLVVNDRVDVALALRARGAQLGQRSLPTAAVRRLLGERAWIGRSVHGAEEAGEALAQDADRRGGVDFLVAGTLFSTESHPGRPGRGIEGLREVIRVAGGVPVIGIGGVVPELVPGVLGVGGHGVTVIRAVWSAEDPGEAVRRFLEEVYRTVRVVPASESGGREG